MKLWPGGSAAPSRKKLARLRLEALEDRTVLSSSGAITGLAFIDRDLSGSFSQGDAALPGATVTLSGQTVTGDKVAVSVVAGLDGAFTFANVLPGSYQVKAAPLTGLIGLPTVTWTESGFSDPSAINTGGQGSAPGGMAGLSPEAVSLRQLMTPLTSFPLRPAGSGQALANYRPNAVPIASPLPSVDLGKTGEARYVDMAGFFSDPDITNSLVRFQTTAGNIDVTLLDRNAPRTVANFFQYLLSGAYNDTIFHRLETQFVLQGGGFSFNPATSSLVPVPAGPPILNEFGLPNKYATLAMAKVPTGPDTATSQFFFNLSDNNSAILDGQNGGFTVFGFIANDEGLQTLSRLTATPTHDFSNGDTNSPFADVPLNGFTGSQFPQDTTLANYVRIVGMQVLRRDEWLTYSVVSNSDANLNAVFEGSQLKLSALAGVSGNSTLVIKATDRYGASATATLQVAFGNRLPTATVSLNMADPGKLDTLVATATKSDPDNDPVQLRYVWKVNDNVVVDQTVTDTTFSFTLSDFGAQVGDVITVEVTPFDGEAFGATASATATVTDHLPVVDTISLDNSFPTVDDPLTVTVTASDRDGDPFTLTYVWKVNGEVVQTTAGTTSLSDTLHPSDLDMPLQGGELIQVEVTPFNPAGDPGETAVDTVRINRPPASSGILDQLFSGPGLFSLNASSFFSDPDGQSLTFSASQEDGSALPSWLSITTGGVLSGNPGRNDAATLEIKVTATDPGGLTASTVFTLDVSDEGSGLNDAPVLNGALLSTASPTPVSEVTATALAVDGDGDPLTYTYVWSVHRDSQQIELFRAEDVSSATNVLNLDGLGVLPGDLLTVEITASDGLAVSGTNSASALVREA
jgi:cyclophilin family peptidyl-prolyl cis-trans isomerase